MKGYLLRSMVILTPLAFACCADKPNTDVMLALPVMDFKPLGDAIRFMSVSIVLAGIIAGVFSIWRGNHPTR